MEFKSLTNIESSFRRIRLMLATFVCCCTLITGYSLWSSYSFAEKQREKIYVLDGGKSLMLALSQDLSQNRPAEAIQRHERQPDQGVVAVRLVGDEAADTSEGRSEEHTSELQSQR